MNFKLRFWGVRGSYPAPGKDRVIGGNTTCLEVEAGNTTLIFDAGTGIIKLGKYLARRLFEQKQSHLRLALFFTHYHQDHVQGLPFFTPLYMPNARIYFLGPKLGGQDMIGNLNLNMYNPFFPVNFEDTGSKKEFFNLRENDVVKFMPLEDKGIPMIGEKYLEKTENPDQLKVFVYKNYIHPKDGSFYYRIEYQGKKVVFATDVEGYVGGDQRLIGAAKNADYLIHDTQYLESTYLNPGMPTQGYGHSTPQISAQTALAAGVKNLILTHHDPESEDRRVLEIEAEAKKIFPDSFHAYEVMEVDVLAGTVNPFTGF